MLPAAAALARAATGERCVRKCHSMPARRGLLRRRLGRDTAATEPPRCHRRTDGSGGTRARALRAALMPLLHVRQAALDAMLDRRSGQGSAAGVRGLLRELVGGEPHTASELALSSRDPELLSVQPIDGGRGSRR